jgi:quinol monooxygenase YgiN
MLISSHNDTLVQGVPRSVPQLNPHRSFTQYGRYRRWVDAIRAEAAALGVHVVVDETLPHTFIIVEVSDESLEPHS